MWDAAWVGTNCSIIADQKTGYESVENSKLLTAQGSRVDIEEQVLGGIREKEDEAKYSRYGKRMKRERVHLANRQIAIDIIVGVAKIS
jgi:hypothetical protein